MLVYYRLPGLVACFALLYYALVVLAIFRLIPVTLTLAGIAGFVLSIGMAVDANILIFERMQGGAAARQVAAAGDRGRLQPGLELHPRLERVQPDHRLDPVLLRLVHDPGFALVLIIGVLVSMFTAITVTRTILRLVVVRTAGPAGRGCTGSARRSSWRRGRPAARLAAEARTRV